MLEIGFVSARAEGHKKRYLPDWTEEMFTISKGITKEGPFYNLTDDSGEILEGSFYEEELQEVIKDDNFV